VLAASQTDWFLDKIRSGDLRGGFLARLTYWPAFEKKDFMAVPPEPDAKIGNELVQRLNGMRSLHGPVELPSRQRERYARWLEEHERELHKMPRVGELSPFWSRLSIVTLKIATLLELSSTGDRVISQDAMESALELTEFLKGSLRWLFEEEFTFSEPMKNRQKALRLVRAHPGIKFRDLLRASNMLKKELTPVLETLIAEESIEIRDGHYWPSVPKLGADEINWGGVSASVSKGATDARNGDSVRYS
jgi:hypothetical protein